MRRLLLALALVLFAGPAWAQLLSGVLLGHYDLDSTSYVSCRTSGGDASAIPQAVPLPGTASAAASATFSSSTGTFAGLQAGDVLVIPAASSGGRPQLRSIVTATSSNSVVVDTAATFTNATLSRYYQRGCGTGDDVGWFSLTKLRNVALTVQIAQQTTTTGIDWIVQCRSRAPGALPTQVYPDNSAGAAKRTFTGATAEDRARVVIGDSAGCAEVRVAFKLTSTDDGTDTGAARELIDVTIDGQPR